MADSSNITDDDMFHFLAGNRLYGDNFTGKQLDSWYAEEAEGYANLGANQHEQYQYEYHSLNWQHSLRHLPQRNGWRILGLGSAYGDELRPLLSKASSITILDPSSAFERADLDGVPLTYVKPHSSGMIYAGDSSFDLATSFGVLHHIANVSLVLREIYRVLANDSFFALREPIVSMGDWRVARQGLTKNERGIPLPILRSLVQEAGFTIKKEALCDFPLTRAVIGRIRSDVFNDPLATTIDAAFSQLFSWNYRYHAVSNWQKLRPASCAMLLYKA